MAKLQLWISNEIIYGLGSPQHGAALGRLRSHRSEAMSILFNSKCIIIPGFPFLLKWKKGMRMWFSHPQSQPYPPWYLGRQTTAKMWPQDCITLESVAGQAHRPGEAVSVSGCLPALWAGSFPLTLWPLCTGSSWQWGPAAHNSVILYSSECLHSSLPFWKDF